MEEDESHGKHFIGEKNEVREEEEGTEDAKHHNEEEEAQWVDVLPGGEEATGNETLGRTSPRTVQKRTTPTKVLRKPQGGGGRRGYWVKRGKEQAKKSKGDRVKGLEMRREEVAGAGTNTRMSTGSSLLEEGLNPVLAKSKL